MDKQVTVAIYSRVSSQDATRQTNLGQKGRLRDAAIKRGWKPIDANPPYSDYESGKEIVRYTSEDKPMYIKQRPNFMRMFADIEKYDGVMVTNISRFGRDEEDIHHFLKLLLMNNKFLYVLEDDMEVNKTNANDPTVKARVSINATMAGIERAVDAKRIKDKVIYSKQVAYEKKERFVWGRKPYRILIGVKEADGTVINKSGKTLLDYVKAKRIDFARQDLPYKCTYLYKELEPLEVIKLYDMGQNLSQIAEFLGCSRQPIRAIIKGRELFKNTIMQETIKTTEKPIRKGLDIEN